MTTSLPLLFEAINQVKDESDLRSQLAPKIGEYFVAKRSGIFFFDQLLSDPKFQKILNVALSIERNPIARYIAERHAPVHERLVTSPKAWAILCPRPDHWHVMAGPIVSQGQLVGVVGCTREQSMPAFDTQNLADLSGVCLHLSVWMTTARSQSFAIAPSDPERVGIPQQQCHTNSLAESPRQRLTARELQIAELVSLGQTNTEIGSELWITENSVKQALKRMFRKLKVSSRAEMVSQLYATYDPSPRAKPGSFSSVLDHQR